MAHLAKQTSSNPSATILRPCCDYSYLFKASATEIKQKTNWLLWLSLSLLSSFFIAELTVGLWSGSLSLLADAGHMLSDVAALGITLSATKLAQQPAKGQATFGHRRIEILAALVNSIAVLAIAAFIAWEAIVQFHTPQPVLGLPMLIVAGVGLAVNSINIALLHKASRDNLNLRGAFLHVVADAASSLGVILAACAVYYFSWTWVDAIVSAGIACFISLGALPVIRESWEILMEYAPRTVDSVKVEAALKSFPLVASMEKLHIWTITSNQVLLSAHLVVDADSGEQRDQLLRQLQSYLEQEFGIHDSTLQLTSRKSTTAPALHPLLHRNLMDVFTHKSANCDCKW